MGEVYTEDAVGHDSLSSITDNAGNTYPILDRLADIGSTDNFTHSFGLARVSGSPTALTLNYSAPPSGGGGTQVLWADECVGGATIDVHGIGSNTSNTTTPTSGNVTTTRPDLVYGIYAPTSANGTTTAGSGFTLRIADATTGAWSETQLQSTAGTIAATFNQTQAGLSNVFVIAVTPLVCGRTMGGAGC